MKHRNVVPKNIGEFLRYSDGKLYWRVSRGRNHVGVEAGSLSVLGYVVVGFGGERLMAHRIVYFLHTGEQPRLLDHVNRVKSDNRIENLRACTRRENVHNSGLYSSNTSGIKGVYWDGRHWRARMWVNGSQLSFYHGPSKEQAIRARLLAEIEYAKG